MAELKLTFDLSLKIYEIEIEHWQNNKLMLCTRRQHQNDPLFFLIINVHNTQSG